MKFLKVWGPVLAWAAMIFYFSHQPNLRITEDGFWDLILRKAAHLVVFGMLAILIERALHQTTRWLVPKRFVVAGLAAVIYAGTDEWHQSFILGRYASIWDVGIDAVGALVALKGWAYGSSTRT